MIKVLGHVEKRAWLVPRLKEIKPYLKKALGILKKNNIKFLTDGFPLCYLPDFEYSSIDAFKIRHSGDSLYLGEKKKSKACLKCSLKNLCSGLREDYKELYGDSELEPSKKNPKNIIKKSRHQLK